MVERRGAVTNPLCSVETIFRAFTAFVAGAADPEFVLDWVLEARRHVVEQAVHCIDILWS